MMNTAIVRTHGSPYDRGSADRYYNRTFSPHYFNGAIRILDLTPEQVAEYRQGWDEEEDRKEYE